MKAKIQPRINLEDRTKLEEIIPLSTPMTLFVDPSSVCNFKCKFCPTGHKDLIKETGRSQQLMSYNLFQKIIDDLKEFDKPLKVLRLYKEGEPLLNDRIADMIRYAKASGNVEYIDTTTNGYLLREKRIKPILEAGLDKINISVNGMCNEHFLKYSGIKVNFKKYTENIIKIYKIKEGCGSNCEIVIKIIGDFLNEKEKNQFFEIFGNHADRIFIENLAPCWSQFNVENYTNLSISREKGIYNQSLPEEEIQTCPYIFYSTTINSDGSVSLCFLDWKHELIIGNVNQNSLKEIWNGETLFQHQINNLKGRRKENPICKNCGQLTHCLPDNIDPYANMISRKLLMHHYERI